MKTKVSKKDMLYVSLTVLVWCVTILYVVDWGLEMSANAKIFKGFHNYSNPGLVEAKSVDILKEAKSNEGAECVYRSISRYAAWE